MKLLAPKDAARLLNLGTTRIQQLEREGRVHAIRDSAGRRLFLEQEVLAFKRQREAEQRGPRRSSRKDGRSATRQKNAAGQQSLAARRRRTGELS